MMRRIEISYDVLFEEESKWNWKVKTIISIKNFELKVVGELVENFEDDPLMIVDQARSSFSLI